MISQEKFFELTIQNFDNLNKKIDMGQIEHRADIKEVCDRLTAMETKVISKESAEKAIAELKEKGAINKDRKIYYVLTLFGIIFAGWEAFKQFF